MPQSLFRRRLADRAGNGDDPRRRAHARCSSQSFKSVQNIMNDVERPGALQDVGMIFIDDRGRRAFVESCGDMIMSVAALALDREEEIARHQRARIDRNTEDGLRQRPAEPRAQGRE